jgi:hypothetical protein
LGRHGCADDKRRKKHQASAYRHSQRVSHARGSFYLRSILRISRRNSRKGFFNKQVIKSRNAPPQAKRRNEIFNAEAIGAFAALSI